MLILFISTYPPIMCGVASYTSYLTREMPADGWKVLSFDPHSYGSPVLKEKLLQPEGRVSYSIVNRTCNPSIVYDHAAELADGAECLVWVQHSFGIWKDTTALHRVLEHLHSRGCRIVVTHHTTHFQSRETPYGITAREHDLLKHELSVVDAITVSSRHVQEAVAKAFPEHRGKVVVIRHGVSPHPNVPREKAREELLNHLLYEAPLHGSDRRNLAELRGTLLNPDTKVIGGVGFISPDKGHETIYSAGSLLQRKLPDMNVISLYIGHLRDLTEQTHLYLLKLMQRLHDGRRRLFLNTYLPEAKLPVALRALDVNLLWRRDCTQSGILSHAQGAGATVVGRDLETVGEALKMSGYPACKTCGEFVASVENILRNPELEGSMARSARGYAEKFCWRNQAAKHLQLAEAVLEGSAPSQHMFDEDETMNRGEPGLKTGGGVT